MRSLKACLCVPMAISLSALIPNRAELQHDVVNIVP